jgi:hypothetical protein
MMRWKTCTELFVAASARTQHTQSSNARSAVLEEGEGVIVKTSIATFG